MGLLEEIEDLKKKQAEAIEAEDNVKEVEEPAVEQETTEEATKDSIDTTEETKEEAVSESVDKAPTATDFARERREKRAKERESAAEAESLRKELEEVRARLAQIEKPEAKEVKQSDPEPDRSTKYEAWLEWKDRQLEKKVHEIEEKVQTVGKKTENDRLINAAVQEFNSYEAEFRNLEPAYDEAAEFYTKRLGESIKMLNPGASSAQIGDIIRNTVLNKAANYAKNGYDPAEELFNEAKQFGFAPSSKDEVEEEIKPNLSKVAENRARNAGTAGAKGRGSSGNLTPKMAAEMTNQEWAKLPASEKKRLLAGG